MRIAWPLVVCGLSVLLRANFLCWKIGEHAPTVSPWFYFDIFIWKTRQTESNGGAACGRLDPAAFRSSRKVCLGSDGTLNQFPSLLWSKVLCCVSLAQHCQICLRVSRFGVADSRCLDLVLAKWIHLKRNWMSKCGFQYVCNRKLYWRNDTVQSGMWHLVYSVRKWLNKHPATCRKAYSDVGTLFVRCVDSC
jgi:hypothetical protein